MEIDEGKTVGILKEEINNKKKLLDQYDADELTIFLAKKNGHWLPSDDEDVPQLQGGDVNIREKHCKPELVMDPTYFLSNYFSGHNAPTQKQIHGLVILPLITEAFTNAANIDTELPEAALIGPKSDLRSCDHLLAFLEGDMTNKVVIVSRPHILTQESLEFRVLLGWAGTSD